MVECVGWIAGESPGLGIGGVTLEKEGGGDVAWLGQVLFNEPFSDPEMVPRRRSSASFHDLVYCGNEFTLINGLF